MLSNSSIRSVTSDAMSVTCENVSLFCNLEAFYTVFFSSLNPFSEDIYLCSNKHFNARLRSYSGVIVFGLRIFASK